MVECYCADSYSRKLALCHCAESHYGEGHGATGKPTNKAKRMVGLAILPMFDVDYLAQATVCCHASNLRVHDVHG
jgi:hypothetical protein